MAEIDADQVGSNAKSRVNLSTFDNFQLQSRVQRSEEGEVVFLSNSEMIGGHLSGNNCAQSQITPHKLLVKAE